MIVELDGEKVRGLREERWWSRAELAKRAGIGESTLRNIEIDYSRVRLNTARKVAKALKVEPKSLAKRSEVSNVA